MLQKQGNDPVFWLNHLFNFGFLAVYMCPRIVRFIDKEEPFLVEKAAVCSLMDNINKQMLYACLM